MQSSGRPWVRRSIRTPRIPGRIPERCAKIRIGTAKVTAIDQRLWSEDGKWA